MMTSTKFTTPSSHRNTNPISTSASSANTSSEQKNGDLEIERFLCLFCDEGHGFALGAPYNQRAEDGQQHQAAEGQKNQSRTAKQP